MFLASKDIAHQEWMVALSRMISGLFRQPYSFEWAIEELRQVYDPKGGYFIPGTKIMCGGVVAHIGYIIEEHCKELGLIESDKLSTEEVEKLEQKASEAKEKGIPATECRKCRKDGKYGRFSYSYSQPSGRHTERELTGIGYVSSCIS
jgi:hypothetical protein